MASETCYLWKRNTNMVNISNMVSERTTTSLWNDRRRLEQVFLQETSQFVGRRSRVLRDARKLVTISIVCPENWDPGSVTVDP